MQLVPILVVTSDLNVVKKIAGDDFNNPRHAVEVDGVGVLSDIRVATIPGMTTRDIALSFAIGVASGFFVTGVSNWLTQDFPQHEVKIYIANDPVRKITSKELEEAIEEYLRKHYVEPQQEMHDKT